MNGDKQILRSFIQHIFPVPAAVADEMIREFREKEISKNEFFLARGRISDEYLFLENGFLRAFTFDQDGNDVTTNFYGSHQLVFEVASFFQRTPSQENIQALTDCYGWCISYQQLNDLFHSIPQFREFGRAVLVKGFAGLKQRMLSMINDTAEIRYEKLLRSNPEIFRYAALKHIASYLGITDSSLSRIRKEFAAKGGKLTG